MAQWILWGVLLIVLVGVAATGLVFVAKRYLPTEVRKEGEVEAIGFVFAVAGVLYAIILAFVVIDVWGQMISAEEAAYEEANALVEQYRYATMLPEAQQAEIHRLSRDYVQHVLQVEWPQMRELKRPGIEGAGLLDGLRTAIAGSGRHLTQETDGLAYETALQQGQITAQAREARLASATSGVPAVLWFVLIGGGLLMISYVYVFDIAAVSTQVILAVGLTVMTVLLLWSVYQMEYPFGRQLRIEPDAFEFALARFAQITKGG